MNAMLPLNRTLVSASYNAHTGNLSILFRKGQTRTYIGAGPSVSYRLAYAKDAASMMSIYSNEIKGKFKVIVT